MYCSPRPSLKSLRLVSYMMDYLQVLDRSQVLNRSQVLEVLSSIESLTDIESFISTECLKSVGSCTDKELLTSLHLSYAFPYFIQPHSLSCVAYFQGR